MVSVAAVSKAIIDFDFLNLLSRFFVSRTYDRFPDSLSDYYVSFVLILTLDIDSWIN